MSHSAYPRSVAKSEETNGQLPSSMFWLIAPVVAPFIGVLIGLSLAITAVTIVFVGEAPFSWVGLVVTLPFWIMFSALFLPAVIFNFLFARQVCKGSSSRNYSSIKQGYLKANQRTAGAVVLLLCALLTISFSMEPWNPVQGIPAAMFTSFLAWTIAALSASIAGRSCWYIYQLIWRDRTSLEIESRELSS